MNARVLVAGASLFACCTVTPARVPSPQASSDDELVLHSAHSLDTTDLEINYLLYGHGAFGGFVRTAPRLWDYHIPSGSVLGPATALKAVVSAPRHAIVLIDVPSVAALPTREMKVDLRLLPPVLVKGRVVPPTGRWNRAIVVELEYAPNWRCEFYGLKDCMIGIGRIARSSRVEPDGAFSLQVPDLGHDPTLAQFSDKGALYFSVVDPVTQGVLYRLAREPGLDPLRARFTFSVYEPWAGPLVLYTYPSSS
jgi:hypothetical protein